MFTVMITSKLGIPVSTTHSITGSTFVVGLCKDNLNTVTSAPHPLTGNVFFVNHVTV